MQRGLGEAYKIAWSVRAAARFELEDLVDNVRLPDLETIRRFSIAVRAEHAPAAEVLEALRLDLDRIERALGARRTVSRPPARSTSTVRRRR